MFAANKCLYECTHCKRCRTVKAGSRHDACLQYVKHWKMRDIKETVGIAVADWTDGAACLLRTFGTKQ